MTWYVARNFQDHEGYTPVQLNDKLDAVRSLARKMAGRSAGGDKRPHVVKRLEGHRGSEIAYNFQVRSLILTGSASRIYSKPSARTHFSTIAVTYVRA